jgi:hypothetical protein
VFERFLLDELLMNAFNFSTILDITCYLYLYHYDSIRLQNPFENNKISCVP